MAEAAHRLAASDPENPLVALARSDAVPAVARRLRRLEALKFFAEYGREGELEELPITVRERAVSERLGVGARSLRRWRRGR